MGIGEILGVIGVLVGLPGFILAFPWIKSQVGALINSDRAIIFGPVDTGKSSLVAYLTSIIPSFFEIKESRRRIFFPKRIGGDYFWGRICLKY
jgi:hypothetical protein